MILENGLIRTLDPQVPTQRALAIAGHRIAGGVGVHETALASPEVVDLGGRVVVPGFTDSHVHFPTWALAQHEVALDGCATLEEALARLRDTAPGPGGWLRGYGWRSGDWNPPRDPTRHDLDAITGDTPAGLIAKDYHSLWLNSAALALANGDLETPGGVVERDNRDDPPACCARRRHGGSRSGTWSCSDDAYLDAMRAGVRLANSRGVTSVHDKDGWLGALRLWRKLEERGQLSLRVWQSIPADLVEQAAAVGLRSGLGGPMLRIGYLKVFMDGTLGSQTAWMLDGSGVQITSGPELAEIVRRGAAAGFPVGVHAIGDRANREALDAFEATKEVWAPLGLRHRIEHASCSRRKICRASRSSGSRAQCSSRTRPRTATSPTVLGRQDRRCVRLQVAARLRRRRRERLGRADRGARAARRDPRRRAALDRRRARRGMRSSASPSTRRSAPHASRRRGSQVTSAGAAR